MSLSVLFENYEVCINQNGILFYGDCDSHLRTTFTLKKCRNGCRLLQESLVEKNATFLQKLLCLGSLAICFRKCVASVSIKCL